MKWKRRKARPYPRKFFAWYPVHCLDTEEWTWLEVVWRSRKRESMLPDETWRDYWKSAEKARA